MVLAMLDYYKVFDSFEPQFYAKFLEKMGIHSELVGLFLDLNLNAVRRVKIGNALGKPFKTYNALGQGDPLTLVVALLYVSVQFTALDQICPRMKKSAVVDDRNIRGTKEDILLAWQFIYKFDVRAGHLTNPAKLALLATTKEGKAWCQELTLEGAKPKILDKEVLVGDVITTVRTGNGFLANKRVSHAVGGAEKILAMDVNQRLKTHGCNAVVIPRLLACSTWTRPAAKKLNTLRNKLVSTSIGRHRLLRCGEVVTAILRDASREDPWGALIAGTILKTRRMLMKSEERRRTFFDDITRIIRGYQAGNKKTPFPGPVSALIGAVYDMGVKLDVDRDNQRLTATPPHGPTMNLLHPSTKVVKANLEKWIRMSILGRLAEQVNTPKPRRKDFAGITTLVDRRATLSLFRTTKSPIKKISVQFFRRLLVSVVAGSVRAGDRLHAAGLIHTDACETDGQRHTTKHLWWECVKYKEVRKEYVGYIERVRAVANKSGKRTSEHIEELLSNNCFLHTGVAPADKEAVEWATARGTEGRPVLEYPDSLRIRQTPGTLWVHINGKRFIAVFTDGSAYCTASEWLAHGGWGVYTPGAQDNTAGHLWTAVQQLPRRREGYLGRGNQGGRANLRDLRQSIRSHEPQRHYRAQRQQNNLAEQR
jgi:hypothetical protein